VKLRVLDLFCGGGGAGMGYANAGCQVTGVDHLPQPRYPFDFIQADALEYLRDCGQEYDFIHASPPCQAYSVTKSLHDNTHSDLIEPTRELLVASVNPYVIENVPGAPLVNPLMLCGTMFDLGVIRHRLFEFGGGFQLWFVPATCRHIGRTARRGEFDYGQRGAVTVAGHNFKVSVAQKAMEIDWLGQRGLAQAIPPAYTEWIIRQFIASGDGREGSA
jgi:DNA (cytosine-5)-methyltransferase 1